MLEDIDELKNVLQLIWNRALVQQSHTELPEKISGLCEILVVHTSNICWNVLLVRFLYLNAMFLKLQVAVEYYVHKWNYGINI